MQTLARRFFSLAMLSLTASSSQAELLFDSTVANVVVEPGDQFAVASFGFTVKGEDPVSFLDLKPSCGCLQAKLDRKSYLPGEKGMINVALAVGDREGKYHQTLSILTDDTSGQTYTLLFNAECPRYVAVDPLVVYWMKDGAPDSRELVINRFTDQALELELPKAAAGHFKFKIAPGPTPRSSRLIVTPVSTSAPYQEDIPLFFSTARSKKIKKIISLQILNNANP